MALDLTRCAITVALGIWDVDDSATFEAGAPLQMNSEGKLELCTNAANFFGVAKWYKTTATTKVVVGEVVTLEGTNNVALAHANLVPNSERVTSLDGNTVYVKNTDYTMNYTNGTIARVSGGNISDGQTVLVSYRYSMTAKEMEIEGRNYMNLLDDTVGSGKMTVIQDYAVVFTDQYDTTQAYSVGGGITVSTNGLFKPAAGGDRVVGRCVKVPSAGDPFLGIALGV